MEATVANQAPVERPDPNLRIVGASHAFIGGRLNLAQAAAIYLPADVNARLGSRFGRPSLLATGLDVHGRRAGRAIRQGQDPKTMADDAEALFRADLELLGVRPDLFLRTDDVRLAPLIEDALESLRARGLLQLRPSQTFHCPTCEDDLSRLEVAEVRPDGLEPLKGHIRSAAVIDAAFVCLRCVGAVDVRPAEQISLRLDRDAGLAAFHERQPGKSARRMMAGQRAGDFLRWEITRDNYCGHPVSGMAGKSLYVWFPALIAKALLAEPLKLDPASFFASDRATFYFGRNIVSYYSIAFMAILKGWLNLDQFGFTFCVRGFCDLDRSRDLLDIREALTKVDRDVLRFFCLYSAPDDVVDFALDPAMLPKVIGGVLERGFGRFLRLAGDMLIAAGDEVQGIWPSMGRPSSWALFDDLHRRGEVRRLLLETEAFARQETKALAASGDLERTLRSYRAVYDILSCYAPEWVRPFAVFPVTTDDQLAPGRPVSGES